MTARIFDETVCTLGEGPLWHPERGQLFWFDILNRTLYSREGGNTRRWLFDDMVSAAGWIDRDRLLVASERALSVFDLETGANQTLCALEADNPVTRSNDGRADPYGGFWIGTMGKAEEAGAGAIYRFYRGELRRVVPSVTVSNAICFSPDGRHAYFADSPERTIWRLPLDQKTGWPSGEPEIFINFGADGPIPDGAVVDADGRLWNAQWGSGRVACYSPDSVFLKTYDLPASRTTCPAFGGEGLATLYVTSASIDVGESEPDAGKTFILEADAVGLPEPRVSL
ncbi:L-arabinolactonase [Hartmannibacter diazotrophicus]|uniref:L-arabinolactonase n=1 Tax=Hartmannibacter diazotrophicus TaxID=1482074 RepID=A0A2C9DCX9_9HYPH|nr:SMP-30/gluconolactonase/LRE family protein [Hartmannibacter diazotrophicus]SON58157.1 L-arabinolactonase [Hartmannibacter diazotrophicus]